MKGQGKIGIRWRLFVCALVLLLSQLQSQCAKFKQGFAFAHTHRKSGSHFDVRARSKYSGNKLQVNTPLK